MPKSNKEEENKSRKDKKEKCKHPMQYRVWTWEGMVCDYCGTFQKDFKRKLEK